MSNKRYRSHGTYARASDIALASAAGYRSALTGNVYTRDTLQSKSGTSGFVDYAINGVDVSNDANMVHLIATIAEGTTTQERIGRKCQLTSVQFRGYCRAVNATGGKRCQVCAILVYDKRPIGTLPAITDILESASPTALNKEDGFDRFKILKRWDFAILGNEYAPDGGSENARSNKQLCSYKSFGKKGLNARYKTDTAGKNGTIDGITEGALYFCMVGDLNAASTHNPVMKMNMRIKFRDVLA